MLDYNPDLIADALDEFRAAEASSSEVVAGPAAVRATVARRRRIKVTTLCVLGALAIALPIAAFASNPRGNNPPPLTESPTPMESPLVSPSPSPSAPSARFTAEQLAAANAPIPGRAMSCPDKVTGTRAGKDRPVAYVDKVVYTNLDSDPELETAARVRCALFDKADVMVAGYDVDDAGRPVFLGSVIKPVRPNDIVDIEVREGGGVVATIGYGNDFLTAAPAPQLREFAWDGTTFKQVAGPAKFPERQPAELSITAGPLNLGPARNGKRTGTVTVTVRNNGPNPSQRLEFQCGMSGLTPTVEGDVHGVVLKPALNVGQTKTYQLQVEVPAASTHTVMNISISSYVNDEVRDNNFVNVAVNRA